MQRIICGQRTIREKHSKEKYTCEFYVDYKSLKIGKRVGK
jgi:hypothetical protein